jgi:hypothetical protein
MNKHRKRIALGRETVRHLSLASLQDIAGGKNNESRLTECECPTALGCGPGGGSLLWTTCTITAAGDCPF